MIGNGDGFIVAGEVERKNFWYPDTLVIGVDGDGERVWEARFSGFGAVRDLLPLEDGFIVSGTSNVLGKYRSFLIKMDYDGGEIWNMTYGGEAGLISEGFGEGFVVAGRVLSEEPKPFGDSDIYMASFLEAPINENLLLFLFLPFSIGFRAIID